MITTPTPGTPRSPNTRTAETPSADFLVTGRWIVCNADDDVLSDMAMAVAGDRIVGLDPLAKLKRAHPRAEIVGGEDVTLGLGLDGTALGDDDDMFAEIRLAGNLQRPETLGAAATTARQAFDFATRGGARLVGRAGDLGEIRAWPRPALAPHAIYNSRR